MLQLNEQEKQVLEILADSSEGEVLLGYLRRLAAHLTDTRTLKDKGGDMNISVEAANRAADIIEEYLIDRLSRVQHHRAEHEPLD